MRAGSRLACSRSVEVRMMTTGSASRIRSATMVSFSNTGGKLLHAYLGVD